MCAYGGPRRQAAAGARRWPTTRGESGGGQAAALRVGACGGAGKHSVWRCAGNGGERRGNGVVGVGNGETYGEREGRWPYYVLALPLSSRICALGGWPPLGAGKISGGAGGTCAAAPAIEERAPAGPKLYGSQRRLRFRGGPGDRGRDARGARAVGELESATYGGGEELRRFVGGRKMAASTGGRFIAGAAA
nr:glycine-rich protein DOT1-like [Lolium perenne]